MEPQNVFLVFVVGVLSGVFLGVALHKAWQAMGLPEE